MLLPSKLVCHRDRLSQPALMSKIVSSVDRGVSGNAEEEEAGNATYQAARSQGLITTTECIRIHTHIYIHLHVYIYMFFFVNFLRSVTSNWLWNVSYHITATLMSSARGNDLRSPQFHKPQQCHGFVIRYVSAHAVVLFPFVHFFNFLSIIVLVYTGLKSDTLEERNAIQSSNWL